jgi:hypothetical protein
MKYLCLAGLVFTCLFIAPLKVQSHDWYPASCCHGTTVGGDCMPAPEGSVSQTATGYHVDLSDPTWGTVHEDVDGLDVRPSQDGQFHICLKPAGYPSRIRCFFAPLEY